MNNNTNNQNNKNQNTDLAQFADLFSVELSNQANPDSSTSTSFQNNSSSTNAINNPPSSVDSSNTVSNSNINSVENNTFATSSNPSNISDVNATTNASANASAGNNVNPTVSNSNTVPITPHSTSTPHPVNYGVPINNVIGVKNPFSSDQFLSIFIGPNCDKFANNVFSLPAFFFGPCYFFYRKLYLVGFFLMILTYIFLGNSLFGILVAGVIEGIIFYPIYRSWAVQTVSSIREENASLPEQQQKELCRQAGGTSVVGIFICLGISLALTVINLLISLVFGIFS